jgi:hypothetical protein
VSGTANVESVTKRSGNGLVAVLIGLERTSGGIDARRVDRVHFDDTVERLDAAVRGPDPSHQLVELQFPIGPREDLEQQVRAVPEVQVHRLARETCPLRDVSQADLGPCIQKQVPGSPKDAFARLRVAVWRRA